MSFLSPALSFFSIGPTRSFAGISGYVTLSESTTDALEITQQPVQQGASIADHAFKKPVNLSIQIQFTEGSALLNSVGLGAIGGVASLLGFGKSLKQIYESLLKLQSPTFPDVLSTFTVSTLKRVYPNMLLATLGCTTDKKTESILSITASFQECIIVPIGISSVPRSLLKNAANNLGTQAAGKKSALLSLAQGIGAAP